MKDQIFFKLGIFAPFLGKFAATARGIAGAMKLPAHSTVNLENALLVLIIVVLIIGFNLYKDSQYKKGTYYQVTKNPRFSLKGDAGKYGEYLIYEQLRYLEDTGAKFLFNVYLPKSNGLKTEIDVLLICSTGLFVFESKNFSGWIFGHEAQESWTQVLPKGRRRSHKEKFYNPIWQNAGHIKYLWKVVGENTLTHSIIVFSDRCTLKDVTVRSGYVTVTHLRGVSSAVNQIGLKMQGVFLTKTEIDNIYHKLHTYTQVSDEEVRQHVESLQDI